MKLFVVHNSDERFRCEFYTLVIKNRALEKHYKGGFTRLDIRFRGAFCYIDAYKEPDEGAAARGLLASFLAFLFDFDPDFGCRPMTHGCDAAVGTAGGPRRLPHHSHRR